MRTPIKIAIWGNLGRMGKAVEALAVLDERFAIVGGVDADEQPNFGETPDVIIDFSTPSGLAFAIEYCLVHSIPLVSGTTGLGDDVMNLLYTAAERIPVLWSSNMSIGINLLLSMVPYVAMALPDYDIELLERHHRMKADAPSGTATAISNAIADVVKLHPLDKPHRDEIGIASLRGGGVIGEHTIFLSGDDDEIIITHRAFNRNIFAQGALLSALFVMGKENGFYTIQNIIEEKK